MSYAHQKVMKGGEDEIDFFWQAFFDLPPFFYCRSVHEGTKEFAAKCPECGKVFNDRGYLSSHLKIHRDRKEYACPHCPKRFNQRVAYNMHLRIHTGKNGPKMFYYQSVIVLVNNLRTWSLIILKLNNLWRVHHGNESHNCEKVLSFDVPPSNTKSNSSFSFK